MFGTQEFTPAKINHPFVKNAYIKKDFRGYPKTKDVLVIEAMLDEERSQHEGFDSHLAELLMDLKALKESAEKSTGPFDRIDIRRY